MGAHFRNRRGACLGHSGVGITRFLTIPFRVHLQRVHPCKKWSLLVALISVHFFTRFVQWGLRDLSMPTNYDFPRFAPFPTPLPNGHTVATPWFQGFTITLGNGTSSDGNCWPMPHAVSTGASRLSYYPVMCSSITLQTRIFGIAGFLLRLASFRWMNFYFRAKPNQFVTRLAPHALEFIPCLFRFILCSLGTIIL